MCKCLENFVPRSDEEWRKQNWTRGCMRKTELFCDSNTNKSVSSRGSDDGFQKRAYAFVNNIGCLVWYKDLIDMQKFSSGGTDVFIRLANEDLGERKQIKLIASVTAVCFIIILGSIVFGWHRLRANQKGKKIMKGWSREVLLEYIGKNDSSELKIYDFDNILVATDGFSIKNKLGQGGFGPVYKGMLPEGKEIAVKRLSSSSGQGVEEFKNEILLISKLQHKNLVRIMGCCVKEDEKLLVYEFMPNKSLDTFLFDPKKRAELDWVTRFNIIQGVARGLLYLHHDSYLKIVHRDLKVSNILLDEKMNPKISDFGLARIVEGTQDLENTQKVVGTRGYISPEYAMGGIYSEKSDVYSFGVLVLEVISSKKTASFYSNHQQLGFLAHAWKLWNEDKGLELVDELIGDSYSSSEVMKCVHIGLLCVQDNATDRPTITDIVLMLSSEIDGPKPKEPLFTIQNSVSYPKPQLQHKNLVKILGCCVKEDEKLLIYEFMPNKSLDTFLFDPTKRPLLDWARRFNIIRGVARGLLYLHHDSCLKVIHRDLKVSNILLDEKMDPKISDFGLARTVEGAQNLVNTHKFVGTLGYISPEYAMGGIFSEKSDVYSFGVLLLEIISGRKNTSFYYKEQQLGFLPYDNAADRPTMPDVVFMLSSVTIGPLPKKPIFTFQSPVCDSQPQYAWHLWKEGRALELADEAILAASYMLPFFVFKTMPWIGQPYGM
ncbi:hypothetical protein ACLB2K_024797 [Fragaria x ananassa]